MAKTAARKTLSMRDVASLAGVSIATVSRVLNDEAAGVSVDTRRRIKEIIRKLNYQPNKIGRALRAQRTDSVALVISNMKNAFYSAIAFEVESILNRDGKVLLLFNTDESPEIQDRCFEEILARQVSGLFLLCAVESPLLPGMVEQTRTVFINRRVESLGEVSFVGIDDYAAARQLAGVMAGARPGPIALVHGPRYSATSVARLDGMLDALREKGVALAPGDVVEAPLNMEGGYRAAAGFGDLRRYRAIYGGNDQIAYGVYRRCRELGLRVPEDVAIYGFDDNPMNEWLAPWLNTVHVPYRAFAQASIAQLDALLAGEPDRKIILPYELILRAP